MKKLGMRQIILICAVVIIVINTFVAYLIYRHGLQQPAATASTAGVSDSEQSTATLKELRMLLSPPPALATHYAVIADKNLFSSTRTAWQEPVVATEDVPDTTVPTKERRDAILYGVFAVGDRRGAILDFAYFSKDHQRQRLNVGESASDVNGSNKRSYTLLSVAATSAQLKDEKGAAFTVSLYANKQQQSQTTVAKTAIVVSADAPTTSSATVVAGSSNVSQSEQSPAQARMQANNEQLVKQGKLRAVNTPFGVSYVPAEPTK